MCDADSKAMGAIGWADLTVADAEPVSGFYAAVTGWKVDEFDMGGYKDYVMSSPQTGRAIAGICHARGANANLPAQWLVYINVPDLDVAMAAVEAGGGKLIGEPKTAEGHGRYCAFQDPSGAVAALFTPEHGHEHDHDHTHEYGDSHHHP